MATEIIKSIKKLNGSVVLPDGTLLEGDHKLGINSSVQKSISETSPFQDFREYLEFVLETLSRQNLGLLLMLDEFDKLQEGIDNGATSPQVPENIRFLIQSMPRFSAILTGSRRMKRLREEYWSVLFGLGTRIGVTALSPDAAASLITEPVKGKLIFAKPAIELAIYLTARQPYLLQCLCNRLFDIAIRRNLRSITRNLVEDAVNEFLVDNEHFQSLWDFIASDRQKFLLYLIYREAIKKRSLRLPDIESELERAGISIRTEEIESDLDILRELEVVDLQYDSSTSFYKLAIPMMGQWLDTHKDYDAIKSRAREETMNFGPGLP